jgi:hypothetical protein
MAGAVNELGRVRWNFCMPSNLVRVGDGWLEVYVRRSCC